MVFQNRVLMDLEDILAFRLECRTCHTSVVWPIRPRRMLFVPCPGCDTPLLPQDSIQRQGLTKVLEGLELLTSTPVDEPRQAVSVGIRLEFDRPLGTDPKAFNPPITTN